MGSAAASKRQDIGLSTVTTPVTATVHVMAAGMEAGRATGNQRKGAAKSSPFFQSSRLR